MAATRHIKETFLEWQALTKRHKSVEHEIETLERERRTLTEVCNRLLLDLSKFLDIRDGSEGCLYFEDKLYCISNSFSSNNIREIPCISIDEKKIEG